MKALMYSTILLAIMIACVLVGYEIGNRAGTEREKAVKRAPMTLTLECPMCHGRYSITVEAKP